MNFIKYVLLEEERSFKQDFMGTFFSRAPTDRHGLNTTSKYRSHIPSPWAVDAFANISRPDRVSDKGLILQSLSYWSYHTCTQKSAAVHFVSTNPGSQLRTDIQTGCKGEVKR
jgi:hypothetical protein